MSLGVIGLVDTSRASSRCEVEVKLRRGVNWDTNNTTSPLVSTMNHVIEESCGLKSTGSIARFNRLLDFMVSGKW